MGRRILNDALRSIVNAEKRGKASVELKPISTVISSFLNIMKNQGYIKNFEVHDPHRVGRITVELQGRVNDCRALTYRQDIKAKDIEKYKTVKLPTRQWGYVVISTPDGVLDHEEAIRRNVDDTSPSEVLAFKLLALPDVVLFQTWADCCSFTDDFNVTPTEEPLVSETGLEVG
ncbi:40S ribosomal protein S15a-5 [Hibiscus syriacus]|uniref:40S ribosomal protein S15a-5 n=1 Tax=Hibiscus syriacus TaxID=106335 RepID=A0A6A3BYT4_HIBSY|nr:40S ribosomal protein S15a-5 [Hibiscus syriacus]